MPAPNRYKEAGVRPVGIGFVWGCGVTENRAGDRPKIMPETGDALAATVAEMSDAELRELAGVVLGELKNRLHDPASRGLSYQHIVSDLQRRLADAHAFALSGFGRRERPRALPTMDLLPAPGSATPPPRASLSEETKARLLLDLEAELVPPAEVADAQSDMAALIEEALLFDAVEDAVEVPEPPEEDNADGIDPAAAEAIAISFEDELWQALQSGVGRAPAQKPTS
jgi:hypothetical protein